MARPAVKRRGTFVRVGQHGGDVDTTGMSEDDKAFFTGTPMNKIESDYVKGTGRASSIEAVKRVRKANKQPPLRGY